MMMMMGWMLAWMGVGGNTKFVLYRPGKIKNKNKKKIGKKRVFSSKSKSKKKKKSRR